MVRGGGGESLRKYLIAMAVLVFVMMLAPAVSAGPKGGWGKGLLSETLEFYVGTSDIPSGYMYWSPETADFMYDFHGYDLDVGACYYLIAFEGELVEDAPGFFEEIGSGIACDIGGVHIKDTIAWPDLTGATMCLVPDTCCLIDDDGDWAPETYQVAGPVDLPG